MSTQRGPQSAARIRGSLLLLLATGFALLPRVAAAQGLTGALIGTVKDEQHLVLAGARVSISSPALIGGPTSLTTNETGQLRFSALPPGPYTLDIEMPGFATWHEADILIGAGVTIERTVELKVAALAESVVVEGAGSLIDARNAGFGTLFGPEAIKETPIRRSSMFDYIRLAPGISATSQGSSSSLVSAFGSGVNENTFLMDGTNITGTGNGVARTEPGIDFIQEIQLQSIGASAEYGNYQGAVVNVITRQGSNRLLYDASYYGQPAGLTSQPVRCCPGRPESGYERVRYRDFTTNLGGPVVRDRLWFFTGYQYVRDFDSQPGADATYPRAYKADKILAKLTWQLAPGWRLIQSLHNENWVNPEVPTAAKRFDATQYQHASIPAITFGHLTNTLSTNTVWDVRVGRFAFSQESSPSSGDRMIASRFDSVTGVTTGAPQQFGATKQTRSTAKATISHYHSALWGADHEWKMGGEFDRGEHHARTVVPTGVRYIDRNGVPSSATSNDPQNTGGRFITAGVFASDAVTVGNRLTISAGVRFDHSRAISQDLRELDAEGGETGRTIRGLGTLYTANVLSPRVGVTAKLSADGRTLLRASYGRFSQGVFTGEISLFHPGLNPMRTADFDAGTGGYTRNPRVVDPRLNLLFDPHTRRPRTDEYSIGVDREFGRRMAVAIAYIRKDGSNFIGWTDVAGKYVEEPRLLTDGRTLQVFRLDTSVTPASARRFHLTNPEGYALTYNGLVTVVEKRRSNGWQAFGSYTWSRAYGLQPYSGAGAAGPQVSTVGSPPVMFAPPVTFGRDPNDLTNAPGRLPNDRPHMFRVMGSVDVPRSGFVVGASLQVSSGKPWAATAIVDLVQNATQRILLEPPGSRRLSSQSLLDVRVSRTISFAGMGAVALSVDVLNALNDTAEESLVSDYFFSPNFGQPNVFLDPRRVMLSVRLNLGR